MVGAIAGDIIGSKYEWNNSKTKNFLLFDSGCEFTDDTVLSVALADCIMSNADYTQKLRTYYRAYPRRGYGGSFCVWAESNGALAYNSYGNGAAMRTSPVGFAFENFIDVLRYARIYAEPTHNHLEGIKGAQATSTAIWMARHKYSKESIKHAIVAMFNYDLHKSVDEIREDYVFDESCQGTVPQAIRCFIDATDFEDAIRNAVSLGGDSDTLACITGGIAQAYYGVPDNIQRAVYMRLDRRLADTTRKFMELYCAK